MFLMQCQADILGCRKRCPRQANLAACYLLLNQSHIFSALLVSAWGDIDGLVDVLPSDLRDRELD